MPKGSPLWIFFGTVRLFFEKIFNVPKGSPLRVFSYFATECMLIHPKGFPFYIFRHYATFFGWELPKQDVVWNPAEHLKFVNFNGSNSPLLWHFSRPFPERFSSHQGPSFNFYCIFSRRILSKWARLLQWQVFFFVRPQNVCVVDTFYRTTKSTEPASGITSELLQRVPPSVYSIFNVRYKTGRDYRVPPLNFFRHCATFFSNFLLSPNGPPSSFLIFCSKLKFQKAQRVPLF